MIKHALFASLALCASLFLSLPSQAATPPIFSTADGAIEGYDPVAYFVANEPQKGLDQFSHEWMGATFKFAKADNLAAFKAAPEKYAPQYGGYCAYAVSEGATAPTVPEAWTITDGKLYLNYSQGVRSRWADNMAERIDQADKNWPGLQK